MDTASVKVWREGDLAFCRGLLCFVQRIKPSPLGIQVYEVQFVDSGDVDTLQKHLLQKIEDFCWDEILDIPQLTPSDNVEQSEHCTIGEEYTGTFS